MRSVQHDVVQTASTKIVGVNNTQKQVVFKNHSDSFYSGCHILTIEKNLSEECKVIVLCIKC